LKDCPLIGGGLFFGLTPTPLRKRGALTAFYYVPKEFKVSPSGGDLEGAIFPIVLSLSN